MDSSKRRDQARTRASSEATSLFSGSSRSELRRVEAARTKSLRSLDARAERRASADRAARSCAGAAEARVAQESKAPRNTASARLLEFGLDLCSVLLITGFHSLERFPHVSGGLLDPL